jgi:hypothetical protein|tara:strand:- start:554 stop:1150 length:597 start_codon:yes stop_codon:yes gene_type:complete
MQLHQVFFVPLITFRFDYHSKYNIADTEKLDRRPKGWTTSVNSSFPNITDVDPIVSPQIRDSLMADLKQQIQYVFAENNIPDKFKYDSFWYNIYHDTQGQEPHTHLNGCMRKNPYWCGIYYHKGSTPTTFMRPDNNNRIHKFPHQSNVFQEYFADTLKPDIKDGDVILFPPYLEHCVEPSTSATMRMTFSFNLSLDNE